MENWFSCYTKKEWYVNLKFLTAISYGFTSQTAISTNKFNSIESSLSLNFQSLQDCNQNACKAISLSYQIKCSIKRHVKLVLFRQLRWNSPLVPFGVKLISVVCMLRIRYCLEFSEFYKIVWNPKSSDVLRQTNISFDSASYGLIDWTKYRQLWSQTNLMPENDPRSVPRVQNIIEQMLILGRIRLVPVSPPAIKSVQVNFDSSSGRRCRFSW